MKTFIIIDDNKPMGFCLNCMGCTLVPGKRDDQIQVYTMEGMNHDVVMLPHELALHLYEKIKEAALKGGLIHIPDFAGYDDDEIRQMIEDVKIEA